MGRRPPISLFLLVLAAAACDRAPSPAGLPQWTPTDHDQEPGRPEAANQGRRATDPSAAPALVELAWQNQCVTCHGATGRGDGPQGPAFKTADLARSTLRDEEAAEAIRNGKGRMPKFDLPDEVVSGLVARVRSLRAR